MKRTLIAALVVGLLAGACGTDAGPGSPGTTPTTSTPSTSSPDDLDTALVAWCQQRTVESCTYALWGLAGDAAAEWCLVDNTRCDQTPPSTTIPEPGTTAPEPLPPSTPADAHILDIVKRAHPGEPVEIAFVLAQPVSVGAAEAIAARLGVAPRIAWRTDYTCIDMSGIAGWPEEVVPVLTAPFDPPAWLAEQREAATKTTITGAHIFEANLERMMRAGAALRDPGVTVLAFSADILPDELAAIASDPDLAAVHVREPLFTELEGIEEPTC